MFSMLEAYSPVVAGCLHFSDSRRARRPLPVQAVKPKLDEQLHGMLARDAEQRRHSHVVQRLQSALRAVVTEPAWRRYLALEEAQAARSAHALHRAARWAFARGRRAASRR